MLMQKRPLRARQPTLPQPGAAVLSAMRGLTSEFGTGSGDPRLHGRARGRRSRGARYARFKVQGPLRATLAAACVPPGDAYRTCGAQVGMRRARAISSARLSGSPRLQLRPINPVFYRGPYRREG